MSDVRDPDSDQQLPIPNDQISCQDLVIADIEERKKLGIKKYGVLLQPFNGRSFLLDAYQEVLDLAVYLRGKLEEERQAKVAAQDDTLLDDPIWNAGSNTETCRCRFPIPVATGYVELICAGCAKAVPEEKLAHKQ